MIERTRRFVEIGSREELSDLCNITDLAVAMGRALEMDVLKVLDVLPLQHAGRTFEAPDDVRRYLRWAARFYQQWRTPKRVRFDRYLFCFPRGYGHHRRKKYIAMPVAIMLYKLDKVLVGLDRDQRNAAAGYLDPDNRSAQARQAIQRKGSARVIKWLYQLAR